MARPPRSAPRTAPWARGAPLQFDDELLAFETFMAPTQQEMDRERTYKSVLSEAAKSVQGSSAGTMVRPIGSRVIGVALPFCGYDFVVEGWPSEIRADRFAKAVSQTGQKAGLQLKVECISNSQLLVLWTIDRSIPPLENTVLLRPDKLTAEFKTSCRLRDTITKKEKAAAVVMRARWCQSQIFELSGTAVAVLVHAVKLADAEPSAILKACFRMWGDLPQPGLQSWESKTVSMEGCEDTKLHPDHPVSIVADPKISTYNLAEKCCTKKAGSLLVVKGLLRGTGVHIEQHLVRKGDTDVLGQIIGFKNITKPLAPGEKPVVAVDFSERASTKEKEAADEKMRQASYMEPAPADHPVFLTGGHEHSNPVRAREALTGPAFYLTA